MMYMKDLGMIVGGLVVFLIGLILSGVVIDTAAATGANVNLGSFSGGSAINNLLPTIFLLGIMVVGLGSMGMGGYNAVKRAKGGG